MHALGGLGPARLAIGSASRLAPRARSCILTLLVLLPYVLFVSPLL